MPLLPALDPPPPPDQSADDDTDQHAQRDPRVARRGSTEAEEDALDDARGGFGGDFGRAGDDFGEGFEDGGTGGHDGGAGDGCVPVSMVLWVEVLAVTIWVGMEREGGLRLRR